MVFLSSSMGIGVDYLDLVSTDPYSSLLIHLSSIVLPFCAVISDTLTAS
jgi:hypothetical protein